jgi:hypothetical protein
MFRIFLINNIFLSNITTCKCDCFESYSGEYCEYSNCVKQSSQCGTEFPPEFCIIDLVKRHHILNLKKCFPIIFQLLL